ncbi:MULTISPECIES: type I secretion system permease/ATPase [unclassified Novosphingobium]|uniref:type I secretion system permease/ATPase n=1 Tax=unclassified Novosphingobium TaxID=2644732 RepID=UPI0017A6D944|nr:MULTISPECIES: type I secretion system permease/ATPase [unclassified Novosphingobium]NMN06309.1 ATP-binding cassette subfamily C protein [Novosphingobium sp. SG919]NMN88607.1 ATP-binding cassette subfamily C protein [Novosphingobium sp. SG916]
MLRLFLRRYRGNLALVAVASLLLNVLVFAGSGYMMLVYDSVLPSRSIPTLVGLFVMLVLIYVFQAVFEAIRAEALLGVANGVHDDLFGAVHYATVSRPLRAGAEKGDGLQFARDLDSVHTFLAGAGPVALIDLPWVIMFLIVLAALHWWLGLTALAGVLVMAVLALMSNRRTQTASRELAMITGQRSAATLSEIRFAESAFAMGMQDRLVARTSGWESQFIAAQSALARTVSRLGGASRTFRMLLQSIILTVGALLVIDDKASGGVILASSVLSGRALAPVDSAIANWKGLVAARSGWTRIVQAITTFRRPPERQVTLDRPRGELALRDLWVAPPGTQRFTVQGVSLSVQPGQALAVIGPSAAGKTSLVRGILGIWKPNRGEVRLDGATLDQWDAEALGSAFGYVPQTVDLIEGTVGQNIARFDPAATSDAVMAAARAASLHEAILALPDGYDTQVSAGASELSAGQRQRVGLARALYGNPHLLILDEANSNLDATGDAALNRAVLEMRQRGGIVIMITHRPATLGPITHVAVMQNGRLVDFGERDTVMQRTLQANDGATAPGAPAPGRLAQEAAR